MLTVKVIDKEGNENLYQTKHVYVGTEKSENTRRQSFLSFQEEGNADIQVSGYAIVYVMNENGKTVADYLLGANLNLS